jgi:hypothetical protein
MIDIVVNPIVNEVFVSVVENPNSVAIVVNEVEQVVYVSVIENSGIATAILVNENGDELSETEIRNDETKTIVAPNADLTLNNNEFTEAFSGATTNIELVDQDNVEITPLSLVGNTIEVERYLFTSIDSGTITPNSIYGILSGETI